jgi:hypothetical protein
VAFQASSSRTPLIGRWAGGAGSGLASKRCWSARVPNVIAAAAVHGAIDGHAVGPREERGHYVRSELSEQ